MYRSAALFALPLSLLLACTAQSEDENVAGEASDITSTADLGTLEASLSLQHDAARIRSEAIVKAGPCYRRMESGEKKWNMRRYTTGAAFFYVDAAGGPLNTLECVDIDIPGPGGSVKETVALSGLTLDMSLRFGLGRVRATAVGQDPTGGGTETFAFNNATIEIATIPARLEHQFGANVPSYEGAFRGLVRSVNAPFVPAAHHPLGAGQVPPNPAKLLPAIANLAYRYAKDNGGTTLTNDPIGRFAFIDDRSVGDFDVWKYIVHFEKMNIELEVSKLEGTTYENLNLITSDGIYWRAGCSRIAGQGDFACWNGVGGTRWEEQLGHD